MQKEKEFDHYRIRYLSFQKLGLLDCFHQNLKREEIYWNLYVNPAEARVSLEKYRRKYNTYRLHWSLKPKAGGHELTPERVFKGAVEIEIPKLQGWGRENKLKLAEKLTQMDQAIG
jgi:hypothetical protein